MATLTQDQILEAIDGMTVLELSEFIKKFEERYGVTAAAPVAAAAAAPAAGAAPAVAAEEQTEFTAVLAEIGPNKIPVIKVSRSRAPRSRSSSRARVGAHFSASRPSRSAGAERWPATSLAIAGDDRRYLTAQGTVVSYSFCERGPSLFSLR